MSHPNVLVITTHDSGRHFGCYGVPTVRTPHIDALAQEGVLFEQMFCASPICGPSRGALLTGQYPQTNGLVGLSAKPWGWTLKDGRSHLSHRLRQRGYHTAMFGVHHEARRVDELDFDDASCAGINRPDGRAKATELAREFADYLENRPADRPFYAQIGFFETHTPYTYGNCPPDDERGVWRPPFAQVHPWQSWESILGRFDGDRAYIDQHLAELQGALRETDDAVGAILGALEAAGLDENTLVLFNTDHGLELPGAKWTMYENGIGIAFMMRWPAGGVTGGHRCDWQLCNVDFLPTLYDLLGFKQPGDFEGVSFADAARGDVSDQPSPRDYVFGHWVDGLNFGVRSPRYKLIRNLVELDAGGRVEPPLEVYDLELDPLELTNVADMPAYAQVQATLTAELDSWLKRVNDPTAHHTIQGEDHHALIADYRRHYEADHGITRAAP